MKARVLPLGLLNEGERAVIVDLGDVERIPEFHGTCRGGCRLCKGVEQRRERLQKREVQRVRDMGLETGRIIEVLKNQKGQPLLVQVENCLFALSRGLAMKILVEPLGRGV